MTPSQEPRHDLFMEHFVRHQDRVFALVRSLLPDYRDAEDAFQQTSLVLWQKWGEFDQDRDFLSWARGIARNVVRNQLRMQARDRMRLSDDLVEALADHHEKLEEVLDIRRGALDRCLADLPSPQSSLMRRCYAGGAKLAEIADEMQLSLNALYLKLSRIRQLLFECIQRRLSLEGGISADGGMSVEGEEG